MLKRQTEPYLATHLHHIGGKKGLPIGGNFELTARCNFHCPMCYVHLTPQEIASRGRELTAAQWIRLAGQARDRGMMFVLLTGGEPFVRDDFFEIYDAMKAMGLMISINSNGSLIDGQIRQRLLKDPPFRINISLYGGCPGTYQAMCGQDAFDRVVANIRALKEAGVDVRINLSITPDNRQDIARIYDISRELGVHVKATSYMYPQIRVNGGQYGCGSRLTAEDAAQCTVQWDQLRMTREELCQRAAKLGQMMKEEDEGCLADVDEGVSCRAGHSSFWLTWDGRMLPCGMMPSPAAFPLQTGFDEAWEQIRKETAQIRMPSECGHCTKRQVCCVCPAICLAETGAFDRVPDYVCSMTEASIQAARQVCRE